ncbi:MAG: Holliday junction branch migration protein RuvA [Cyclobacteriaceae bacterium]|nr:Holliday junction branch migration protein RuvA [Cyclobacteriaceae bacterium]
MIAYINGKLAYKDATYVIIDVNGIGYHINISLTTYSAIKDLENCKLHTYLHVKEDSQTLYGFSTSAEKKIFLNLISISGVGPSTGLMVQSSLSAEELQHAIINEDVKTIQSVKGIGGKTAQRIILELKDKLAKEEIVTGTTSSTGMNNTIRQEALSALITLGFNKLAAEKTINNILKISGNQITLEALIKQALKTA